MINTQSRHRFIIFIIIFKCNAKAFKIYLTFQTINLFILVDRNETNPSLFRIHWVHCSAGMLIGY